MMPGKYVKKLPMENHVLWNVKKPLLYWLEVELTERCNNQCIHCGINLPENDAQAIQKELKTEEIKNILKEAAALGCMVVKFTGGEPLVREDFSEIYVFARRIGLKVMILTNATLVTPKLAELFSRIPPLEKIEVSLYGMKRTSYEAVSRIPGSFAKAWEGIHLLLEKKIPVVLKQIQLPPNKDEIKERVSWPESFSDAEKFTPMAGPLILRCRRDSQYKNQFIGKLRPSAEQFLKLISERSVEYTEGMRTFIEKFTGKRGRQIISCGAGKGIGCLDAYGNLQLCLLLRHPDTVFDLRKRSIKEAMSDFFPRIRQMQASNPEFVRRCANCVLRGLCEQCPAQSWIEHGTLDTPVDYYCEIAQIQARFLGLLGERERPWDVANWQERVREFAEKTGSSKEKSHA